MSAARPEQRQFAQSDGKKSLAQPLKSGGERLMTDAPNNNPGNQIGGSNAFQIAQSMLLWAKAHNLFSKVPIDDAIDGVDDMSPLNGQSMFSQRAVEDVLRKRSINLIGFNEKEKKVVVFTNGKINSTEKKILPFHISGYSIEYIQGGVAQAKGNPPQPENSPVYKLRDGVISCGSSIYPANCIGAGTLGFLAKDSAGNLVGVTNNHVAGACNHAAPGLPILAPGPLDVTEDGIAPFTVGRHWKLLPINDGIPENIDISQNCDASAFQILDPARVSSMQGNRYDTPATVLEPEAGMRVEKIGRTTGLTIGTIVAEAASPLPISYAIPEYNIRKSVFFPKVYIVQGAQESMFSKPGDSGSLVTALDDGGNRVAVGLIFAGNEQKGLSFILGLPTILEKLELQILNGHNCGPNA